MTTATVIGVDVGGTFTDLVLMEAGEVRVAQVPTTPDNQAFGVLGALDRAGARPARPAEANGHPLRARLRRGDARSHRAIARRQYREAARLKAAGRPAVAGERAA